jgi:hypothetical protein
LLIAQLFAVNRKFHLKSCLSISFLRLLAKGDLIPLATEPSISLTSHALRAVVESAYAGSTKRSYATIHPFLNGPYGFSSFCSFIAHKKASGTIRSSLRKLIASYNLGLAATAAGPIPAWFSKLLLQGAIKKKGPLLLKLPTLHKCLQALQFPHGRRAIVAILLCLRAQDSMFSSSSIQFTGSDANGNPTHLCLYTSKTEVSLVRSIHPAIRPYIVRMVASVPHAKADDYALWFQQFFGITCHGARHTGCSLYLANGSSKEQISKLAGHASSSMTQGYLRDYIMSMGLIDFIHLLIEKW